MAEQKIGRYVIKGKLGKGSMALVLHAYDPRFQRDVALKVLHTKFAKNAIVKQRFIQEARTIASLDHPAIVPIYDAAQEGEYAFLVMRLMDQDSLLDRIEKGGSLSIDEIAPIIERVGSALDAAHAAGIVHRDVKPDNIMFDRYGAAYLADFGIVKVTDTDVRMTTDTLIGTPAYMSPEQVNGTTAIDGRSDIYALGAVLYELLTGRLPYHAETALQMAMQHVTQPVPRLQDHAPELSKKWQSIISRAMAKDPADRYQTGAEFTAAVTTLSSSAAGKPTLSRQQRRLAPIALFVILILLSLSWGLYSRNQQNRELADARAQIMLDQTATIEQQFLVNAEATASAAAANVAATELAIMMLETGTAIAVDIMGEAQEQTDAMETAVAQTMVAILPTNTSIPTVTPTPEPTNTSTATPTATLEEVAAEEITSGSPRIQVRLSSVNLRKGPGVIYEAVGFAENGTELAIVGRNDAASWYEVALDGGQMAWVSAEAVTLLDVTPEAIAMAEIPVPPTRTPTRRPTLTPTRTNTPRPTATRTPSLNLTQTREAALANFNTTQTAQAIAAVNATRTREAASSNFNATQTAQAIAAATQAIANARATQTREAAVANFNATQTAQAVTPTRSATATMNATRTPTLRPTSEGNVATVAPPTAIPTDTPTPTATATRDGSACAPNEAIVEAIVQWGNLRMAGATLRLEAFSGGGSQTFTTNSNGFISFCFEDLGRWYLGASASTDFGVADSINYAPDSRPLIELKAGQKTGYTVYVALRNSFQIIDPARGATLPNGGAVNISWQPAGYPQVAIYDILWKDMLEETIYRGGVSVGADQASATINTGMPNFEKARICFRLQMIAYDINGKFLGYVGDLSNERFCVQQ